MANCKAAIKAEKKQPAYSDNGQFSKEKWEARWPSQNRFQVFRAMCLARIEAEKSKDKEWNYKENTGSNCGRKWLRTIKQN